jgi:hypothetical protein
MRQSTAFVLAVLAASCRVSAVEPTSSRAAGESGADTRLEPVEFVRRWTIPSAAVFDGYVHSCHALPDIDRDGVRELLVQTEDADEHRVRARVISGSDGRELYQLNCPKAPDALRHFVCMLGVEVCTLSDLDGDGVADFALSDPSAGPLDGQAPPYSVLIVSAKSGVVLHAITENSIPGYGASLGAIGDLDGDGFDDLLVRSASWSPVVVDALSGRTGQRLYRIKVGDQSLASAYGRLAVCEDANGDGVRDFLVVDASWTAEASERLIQLRSGADGSWLNVDRGVIERLLQSTSDGRLAVGDLDRDGISETLTVSFEATAGFSTAEVRAGVGHELMASLPMDFAELGLVEDLDADGFAEVVVTNSAESGAVVLYSLRSVARNRLCSVHPSIARREKAR